MKKSELIKSLKCRFDYSEDISELAERIIDYLVSQGMQPPDYVKETIFGNGKVDEVFYGEWESEETP